MVEIWISRGCEWSATQHPKVWPWADLVFCSSRRHINRGIIPLMLKLSFVHIMLALTWVADTADKWLFLPSTPPTSRSTNGDKPELQRWPLQYGTCVHNIWAGSNIWEGISPSGRGGGTRSWCKLSTCTFYCNWWPILVLSKLWQHWLAPGTKTLQTTK